MYYSAIETYFVFLFTGVHKPSGWMKLFNDVTAETLTSWNISVMYYIV